MKMTTDPRHPLVLVIDDDADTRELYHLLLESVGYRVQAAGTVKAGIDLAHRTTPDVVLTDWRLPDGDGFSVSDAFRERAALRHVPLVAVSGLSFKPDMVALARTRGFVEMLVKPALPDTILRTVRFAGEWGTSQQLRAAAARLRRYSACALRRKTKTTSEMTPDDRSPDQANAVVDASILVARAAARSRGNITLMLADDSAHYVAAGGSARELTGYDPQELVSLSVWDLTAPPDVNSAEGLWGSFIVSGTQEGKYTLRRRDGAPIEAQYCAIANVIPGLHVSAIAEASQIPDSL